MDMPRPPETAGRDDDGSARTDFRRMMIWIAAAGVAMVAGALWYLSLFGPLTVHMVVAATLGVFLSVLLGSGLFAAAFFSAKSGHDQQVTDATRGRSDAAPNPTALPDGLEAYRRTESFTEATVPAGLLSAHSTKPGVWGLIHVTEGLLRYRVSDVRRAPLDTLLTADTRAGIVEPTILHQVEPIGHARFHVEFWREPAAPSSD